jgi:hypothetical protein
MPEYTSISSALTTPAAAANNSLFAGRSPAQNSYKDFLRVLPIQCKLSIGSVNDPLEDEADAMADKVMRMPEPNFIQRKCAHCEEEENLQRKSLIPFIQKKANENSTASNVISSQIRSTKGSGNRMTGTTKSFMENRFGADFSHVNIHTGSYASQLSNQLNAQAFTVGNDVYFNEGKYQPESSEGKHLLAHELMHTIQEGGNESKSIRRVPAGCVGQGYTPLQPAAGTNPQASWTKLIIPAPPGSTDKDKQDHAKASIPLFLQTSSGQWMITQLDNIFSTTKGCKNVKIELKFVDKTSDKSTAWGLTTNDGDPTNLYPCDQVNSYTVEIVYRLPETNVIGEYDTAEAEMADTLQHEFGHVWFVNTYGQPMPGGGYTTGHGNLDLDPKNIDPRLCAVILSISQELYAMQEEARRHAVKTEETENKTPGDLNKRPDVDLPGISPSASKIRVLGLQATAKAGVQKGGPFMGLIDIEAVLGKATSFHLGARLIMTDAGKLLPGVFLGGRFMNDSPVFVDIDAGIIFQAPDSRASAFFGGGLGYEFKKDGFRPFVEIGGWVVADPSANSGADYVGTVGIGGRY